MQRTPQSRARSRAKFGSMQSAGPAELKGGVCSCADKCRLSRTPAERGAYRFCTRASTMIFCDRTRNNVYERVPGAGKKELSMRARTMQAARLTFRVLVSSLFSSRGMSRISARVNMKQELRLAFRLASQAGIIMTTLSLSMILLASLF